MTTETTVTPLLPDSSTNFSADPLWQRLETFNLDDADAPFPFSAKLARENKWDAAFAQAAILEYKRFVYLCCTLPQGASPPPIVDEVWHLHLCYTVNYWEVFCETILQRKLHHHPNKGGATENERHHNWLDDTLVNYRSIFGTEPPEAIWNPAVKAQTEKVAVKNTSIKKRMMLIAAVAACLIFSGCSSPAIGLGFISLLILVVGFSGTITTTNEKKGDGSTSGCGGTSGCSGGDGGGGGCGGGCGGCSGGCGS